MPGNRKVCQKALDILSNSPCLQNPLHEDYGLQVQLWILMHSFQWYKKNPGNNCKCTLPLKGRSIAFIFYIITKWGSWLLIMNKDIAFF